MTDLTPIGDWQPPSAPSSAIQKLRSMLGEAGEQFRKVIKEEVVYIIPESDKSWSVYVKRKEVHQVVGVYLSTDENKTNNYYIGNGDWENPDGQFEAETGVITLSNAFTYTPMARAIVDYVHLEGLTNSGLQVFIDWAQTFIYHYTNGDISVFNEGTKEWWAMLSVAKYACILKLNAGSVLQSGYNLRIEEFALETKAWGEGMIAQFLLQQYKAEVDAALANVGWGVRFSGASRQRVFPEESGTTTEREVIL